MEASGQEGEDEDSQDFLKTGSKWIGKRVSLLGNSNDAGVS